MCSGQVVQAAAPDKRVYEVTPEGREQVASWLLDISWPKVAPAEFHLKLVAAAATGLADPIALIDAQRRDLLRRLRDVQRLAWEAASDDDAILILEGTALRLQRMRERRWSARGPR